MHFIATAMGVISVLFKKWITIRKKISFFQAKASSLTIARVKCYAGNNDGSGFNAPRCWNISNIDRCWMSPVYGWESNNCKFIGALPIRPTMMIVMGWSQVISARRAIKEIQEFLEESKYLQSG